MLRFRVRPCTSCCCVRSRETNDSASARSSASSRSAWSTSRPRSRRAAIAVTLADLRFSALRSSSSCARTRPALVGIAGMHALETDEVLALAREVRRLAPDVPIVVGGHTAAAYPEPFLSADVDAVVLDDGERALPEIVDAHREGPSARRGARAGACATGAAASCGPAANPARFELDDVPLPARHLVDGWRRQYACLAHRPTWLIETARGCPFRCSFCSIWQLHARSVRERSIESVCQDFASLRRRRLRRRRSVLVSPVAKPARWRMELRRRGIRKKWILVQSRVDLVARHADLLEAWRPIAQRLRHLLRPRGRDQRRA